MTDTALLCSESPISLAVIRELGAHGVAVRPIVRRTDSFLCASRYAGKSILRPSGAVADWLEDLARREGIDKVMAIGEADVLALAELRQAGSPLLIAAPLPEQMRLVLDKQALLGLAEEVGLEVPRSWQPTGSDLSWLAEDARFPLVAKWSDPLSVSATLDAAGLSLDKVIYCDDRAALTEYLARFDGVGVYPIVQEYAPGYGLGQMVHAMDGEITLRFQHRRLREWPLSGGVSSLCEAVPLNEHAELRAQSEALLGKLRWTGPAMVEFRHDPATGRSVLMEINGRFWGSLPLASAAGVQFGWESWRHAFGYGKATVQPAYPQRAARYMAPEMKNLRDVWTGHGSVGAKLGFSGRFLARFLDPRVRYYVWRWSDPAPLWADLRNLTRRA